MSSQSGKMSRETASEATRRGQQIAHVIEGLSYTGAGVRGVRCQASARAVIALEVSQKQQGPLGKDASHGSRGGKGLEVTFATSTHNHDPRKPWLAQVNHMKPVKVFTAGHAM